MRCFLHRRILGLLLAAGMILPQLLQDCAHAGSLPQAEPVSIDPKNAFQQGASLTRQGKFAEAAPFLIAASRNAALKDAANFNLALCYVGLRQYPQAMELLEMLRASGYHGAQVNTLLAQTYIGMHKTGDALNALKQAHALSPASEKPYLFAADACTDNHAFDAGLLVTEAGLRVFPASARLHYEHAMFLAQLDRFEEAKPEFEKASALDQGGNIAYLSAAQEDLFLGDVKSATQRVRSGLSKGLHDAVLETLLAEILMHGGAAPGQADFTEAKMLLEDSVALKPEYSTAQIALGKAYLMEGRFKDAIDHLEAGRRLEPENRAVYTGLAHAYRRIGNESEARIMLDHLQGLMQASGHY